MALQFTTIEEPSLSRGIDARSAENQIRAGFAKDLVNIDIVEGRASKRKGYISHAGYVPVRVREVEQTYGKLSLTLDSSIDLARIVPGPIAIHGQTSNIGTATAVTGSSTITVSGELWTRNVLLPPLDITIVSSTVSNIPAGAYQILTSTPYSVTQTTNITIQKTGTPGAITALNSGNLVFRLGPFVAGTNFSRYYDSWTSNLRKVFTANTSSSISVPVTEHNINSSYLFVGTAESTSSGGTKLSGSTISTDTVVVSNSSYNILVGYTNNTPNDISTFIYYADQTPVLGKSYTATITAGTGTTTQTIGASVHGLDNYNITYQLYSLSSGLWTKIEPDSFVVNSNNGNVTIEITNITGAPLTCRLMLTSVANNRTIQSIGAAIGSTTIPNIDNPYLFYTVYSRNSLTGILTEVKIDESTYDDDEKEWTLSWTEAPVGIETLEVYYSYGSVRTNKIVVTDDFARINGLDEFTQPPFIDTIPQLSIYGLSHTEIYGDEKNVNHRGWVTHLDSYRSTSASHVVAGLGGNFFSALTPADSTAPEMLPTWYCKLNARVLANTVVGPAFADSATPQRTRGQYYFSGGTFGWATVTGVRYIGSGNTQYYLSMPNGNKEGIDPVVAGDFLTVENMSHSRHSGTFEIVSFDDTTLSLPAAGRYVTVTVKNPKLTTTDYDDFDDTNPAGLYTGGRAGVFTDQVTLTSNSPFVENDTILSSAWGNSTIMEARFPPANPTTPVPPSSTLLLKNCYSFLTLNAGLALTGKRTSATIPLRTIANTPPESLFIVPGDVLQFSELERELRVVSVNPSTKSVTLDEEIEWYDDLSLPPSLGVARRWHPVEVPLRTATDVLIPPTTVQHFSSNAYDSQPFIRSAMVSNNLYLTNGDDEVYKYDGSNVYRAGLIPWQPGLFAALENVSGGGLALTPVEVTGGTFKGASVQVIATEGRKLKVGDLVQITFSNGTVQTMTVAGITEVTNTNDVSLTFAETFNNVTAGTAISSIRLVYYATYFFRLNARDKNGVVIASAVTGDESFIVQVVPSANFVSQKVLLRLVGMPAWDQYDYRSGNIELEIYRTAWATQTTGEVLLPYRLKTIPLTYEQNSGYIDFIDTYSNLALSTEDTDRVSRVLSPTEVPVDWDEPVRAKYMTTAGNRLVLANVTNWPELTVNYLTTKDTNALSFNGQKFLFRRDATDIGTSTDMLNRVTYEVKEASSSVGIYPVSTISPGSFQFAATSALPGTPASGDWVYLYHSAVTNGSNSTFVVLGGGTLIFPTVPTTVPVPGSLVHFSTTGTLPSPLISNEGYFVVTAAGIPTNSVKNQATNATVLSVNSVAGFPPTGVLVVAGNQYRYTGINVGTNEFTGISPAISVASGVAVTVLALSVSTNYNDVALSFATTGTGTQSLLWDGSELEYSGWWQIASNIGGVITIRESTTSFTTVPTQFPDRALFASMPKDVPVLVGTDGNMGMTDGNSIVTYLNVIRRLGMAINSTMRVVDTKLPAYSAFRPWLTARSEAATGGQLIVKRPRADAEVPSLTMTAVGTGKVPTYINSEVASVDVPVLASITRYPSRVLISYNNYPEIFSNPFTVNLSESDSAVDVNAADGQEITGIVPFFGSSAFDAAQQSGVLVVFKQNSIYVLNTGTREVQKLETQGLGCSAPYSIAPTKDGVAFANETGIYVLRPNLRIEYLGRYIERNWQQAVDLNKLHLVQGHHYGAGRQYKLSVPLLENSSRTYGKNEEVYVYNYTGEADGEGGAWTRYTNHPATGWANLLQDAFFATVDGTVMRIRNLNEPSDYRDEDQVITSVIETRPTAFENTAIRKAVSNVVVHYRSQVDSSNTTLGMALDMANEYQISTAYKVVTAGVKDGLSSTVSQSVTSIMHSFPKRKCTYASVQIVNSGLNENVEVAGMSYVVAGLSGAGIKQAAETEG